MHNDNENIRDAGVPGRRSRRRRDERRRGERGDGGFTYVEVVITIVLMGVVVLPILTAVRSSVRAASVSRAAAEVETVLVNAADLVTRASRDGFKCDLTGPAQQAAAVEWNDTSQISVGHEHWNGDAGVFEGGACPGAADGAAGGVWENGLVQRITITVTSPRADVSRTIQVVKGDF